MQEIQQASMAALSWKVSNALKLQRSVILALASSESLPYSWHAEESFRQTGLRARTARYATDQGVLLPMQIQSRPPTKYGHSNVCFRIS